MRYVAAIMLLLGLCADAQVTMTGTLTGGTISIGTNSTPPLTLNVTDFGAVGDYKVLSNLTTVSNSASVVCPNITVQPGDVGKVIEVVNGGLYSPSSTSNETFMAYITAQDGVHTFTVATPLQKTFTGTGTGVYYSNNQLAFSNCIAAASAGGTTNIYIPVDAAGGVYGFINPSKIFTNNATLPSIVLNRGGIHFIGIGGKPTLQQSGGWRAIYSSGYGTLIGARGQLFRCSGMTNDYPTIFDNLIMDGGVQTGNQGGQANYADPTTGENTDVTHDAILTTIGTSSKITSSFTFTNCELRHWRGEMVKDTVSQSNVTMYVQDSIFGDGLLTCINNYAQQVTNSYFHDGYQMGENYVSNSTNESWWRGCIISNMSGIAFSGLLSNNVTPPQTVDSNIFYIKNYAILGSPVQNLTFKNNQVYKASGSPVVLELTGAGYQGSGQDSNILFFNNFIGQGVVGVTIGAPIYAPFVLSSNACPTGGNFQFINMFGGNYTNSSITMASNNCPGLWNQWTSMVTNNNAQWPIDPTNNTFGKVFGSSVEPYPTLFRTNALSYGFGGRFRYVGNVNAVSNVFYLAEDTRNPDGAIIQIKNVSSFPIVVYGNSYMTNSVTVTAGNTVTTNFIYSAASTNWMAY